MSKAIEIDCEILITLIESRPTLWDKTLDTYKNKILTKNLWREICTELDANFENLSDDEKNKFGKEIMKRWANIRDSYMKSKKKIKEATTSGAGASHLKKYIYNDQLHFLSKVTEERPTEDSMSTADEVDVSAADLSDENVAENSFKKPRYDNCLKSKKKNKIDPFEEKMIQLLKKPEEENRHISFFKGIIPSLSGFDEDEIMQLQMGVLQLISNIKRQKSRATMANRLPAVRNYNNTPLSTFSRGGYPGGSSQQVQSVDTEAGGQYNISGNQQFTDLQPSSASQFYSSYGQQCFSPGTMSDTSSVSSIDFTNNNDF